MPAGRPAKPVEQKRLLGNPGKRALPGPGDVILLPMASARPEPLRGLGSAGLSMWDRVWDSGIAWISPGSDIELLQMTCEMLDERESLRDAVASLGEREDRRSLRELEKQIVSNLSLLGFSPSDRTRLGVAEVRATRSALEDLRAQASEL